MIVKSVDEMEEPSFAHVENFKWLELAELHEQSDELSNEGVLKLQCVGVEQEHE